MNAAFIDNKYSKIYFQIIDAAKSRTKLALIEKHHIIPSCIGGSNDVSNIAFLSPREHYLVHLLLTKMTHGESKRKMSFALSFFNTGCKNHTRAKPSSRWYEYSRKLLSEAMKGRQPSQKCKEAVSKAKKGIPLSIAHRRKMSDALLRTISFFAVSPDNIFFKGNDLRKFCRDNGLSYFTIKGLTSDEYKVLTAGNSKGWIISKCEIKNPVVVRKNALILSHNNRSKAVKKQWTEDRKISNSKIHTRKTILIDPSGNILKFNALQDVVEYGPVSTIQLALPNHKFTYGKWAGWTKVE